MSISTLQDSPEQPRESESRDQDARRTGRLRLVAVMALAVALAAVVALAVSGGGSNAQTAAANPFGPHWSGVSDRVRAAGLPAQGTEAAGAPHSHQQLYVVVRGRRVPVPSNIGIPPGGDTMPPLHTHTPDGTLHVEGVARATLGQFMQVWGVSFSADQLGPYRNRGAESVRMWVKPPGSDVFEESKAFERLKLRDGQAIFIAYGTRAQAPA